MKRNTHAIIGCALAISFITSPLSLIALYGSIAPDLDIKLGMRHHRTFTHSLLFLGLSSFLFYTINKELGFVWAISYSVHLFLDSLTVSGVPLLYPFPHRFGLKWFHTDGWIDNSLEVVCWLGLVLITFQKIITMFK